MNSSTGIPFSTCTFLKIWSDIWIAGCGACPTTRATLASQTIKPVATARLDRRYLNKEVICVL
jgi:hypothetical protein